MRTAILVTLVAFLAACKGENTSDKPVSQANPPAPAATFQASAETPAAAPSAAPAAQAPSSAASAVPEAVPPTGSVSGKVLETMDSGGYTYLKLSVGGGEVWAAVNQAKVKKGSTVTVVNAMQMEGFESKTLHRKFDRILFGTLGGGQGAPAPGSSPADSAAAGQAQMPAGHPDASDPRFRQMMAAQHAAAAQGPADVGEIKVPRAEGANAKTVAEIFAGRTALNDKEVVLRGKVVKFLPGIMGRNWLHLRDGSGSASKKDNDLTVTTGEMAAVGDVVLIRGTVKTDQDFGAGYAYPVLVEGAHISK